MNRDSNLLFLLSRQLKSMQKTQAFSVSFCS